jgi:hypothetical protein
MQAHLAPIDGERLVRRDLHVPEREFDIELQFRQCDRPKDVRPDGNNRSGRQKHMVGVRKFGRVN